MATSVSSFGKPSNYGDWTQYAGFDPSKPMMGAVMPPSFGGAAPTFGQMKQKAQSIVGSVVPVAAVTSPQVTVPAVKDLDGDGMISDWEE
jgi:hypothetical protein